MNNSVRGLLRGFSPLALQLLAVVGCVVAIVLAVVISTGRITERSRDVARDASAAHLRDRIETRVQAAELYISRSQAGTPPDMAATLQLHDSLSELITDAKRLADIAPEARMVAPLAGSSAAILNDYFKAPDPQLLRLAANNLAGLRETLNRTVVPAAPLASQNLDLSHAAEVSRWFVIGVALITGAIMATTTFFVGRSLREVLQQTVSERDSLAEMTRAMKKRNEQFSALYQVVSEVTDTLNLRYVVATTLKEAKQLIDADYVALRLLEGDSLITAGSTGEGENEIGGLLPIPLGEGLVGRAAKRGRTVRVDENAESHMSEGQRIAGAQSGLIVPLIVGARVLGTLGCWSTQPFKFDSEDERILEMMASQVATAVASASLHESSEERASHDALTGLPNRRQLIEDMHHVNYALRDGVPLAVAMLDIDHFKHFNDEYGHRVGDVTLQRVADVIKATLPEGDHVYRYGGEEFLIVCRGVLELEAVALMERLRRAVQATPLTGESMEPVGPITLSIGLAMSGAHRDFNALVREADEALYVSKEGGRNLLTLAGQHVAAAA